MNKDDKERLEIVGWLNKMPELLEFLKNNLESQNQLISKFLEEDKKDK